ncbi:hypothetical protein AB1A65_10160 [Muricauda sp. ANG21]|uniref:hypothetical protein n=1 Tax=Allomuricauda sp. ANG21 TaxID=3042468 RepID=UPI0034553277
MKLSYCTPRAMLFLVTLVLFFSSCAKDSDLFDEYVIEPDEEVVEPGDPDQDPDPDEDPNPDEDPDQDQDPDEDPFDGIDFSTPDNPENTNKIEGTYTPTSMADITNPANANLKAVISQSFNCNSCTFAAGQTIEPAGGVISGSNINLNGAYIENTYKQAFAPSVTFSETYNASRVSPETFGANAGDNSDDTDAIDAMINNVELAVTANGGTYIKNRPTNYRRSGILDWNMNGAVLKVTSAAGFNTGQVSVDAVFDITNLSPTIYNGEFDGTNTYGRLFYLHGQEYFRFQDLYVHNFYASTTYRAVAFRFTINASESGFKYGEFSNCVIDQIVAQGDGNYNNAPAGISKGWWYTISGINYSDPFTVLHTNNKVTNIIGDDAEAFYAIQGGGSLDHDSKFVFDNEDYRYCTRRAIKACVSNVEIKNSYFEEIPESMFNSAQQMGTMIDFFSTQSSNLIQNIYVHDNVIRTVPGSDAHYYLLSMTEVDGAVITNNTFTMETTGNYGGVRLGSNTSSYNGALKNINITDNVFNNCYVNAMYNYAPVANEPINVDGNVFNFTASQGIDIGAMRFSQNSGSQGYVNFINNDINVDASSANGINGVIASNGVDVVGVNLENININYSNSQSSRPFGYLRGNFNSSNTIKNCNLTGASGINALEVLGGTQSVQLINSTDASGNPITIK